MASRQEEKRRLREERLAQEQAAAASASRQRRLRLAGAVAFGLVAVAGIIFAISSGGASKRTGGSASGSARSVTIPKPQSTDLKASVAAAGCQVRNFPNFGQQHTSAKVMFKTNPPTSGAHNPVPAQDGSYRPDNPPAVANAVHALEHGRIEIQWKPGLPARAIGQLQTLFNEQSGVHALLFANQTNMPYQVAASAWQHYLGCPRFTPKVFDAIRNFRKTYTDKAPEQIP